MTQPLTREQVRATRDAIAGAITRYLSAGDITHPQIDDPIRPRSVASVIDFGRGHILVTISEHGARTEFVINIRRVKRDI